MKRVILAAAGLLAAVLLPIASGAGPATAAVPTLGWPGLGCTMNHWIRDVSNGNRLVGIGPGQSGWQLEDTPSATYPTGYIFVVCSNGNGQLYLQLQIPPVGLPNDGIQGSHAWVGVNVAQRDAITATANAPGPHEAFAAVCTGTNQERIHWALDGDDTFTITTTPPSLWTTPPPIGLPGTLYEISGIC